jgi:5-methyltetrahydrofolate--homocysteine methyltransferase
MCQELMNAIIEMREEDVIPITEELLAAGADPLSILDFCREAMSEIGRLYEAGDCFVPELIMAGEMLGQVSARVKPHLTNQPGARAKLGRVVMGTVEGDIHDIGKDIVTFVLDVNGFEVRDLGVDVPASRFVEAVREFQPQVVGLSGFLTLAYDPMKNTVQALRDAGLRDAVKIMIGGGQVDETIRQYTGADAYGKDAMAAVALAKGWVGA